MEDKFEIIGGLDSNGKLVNVDFTYAAASRSPLNAAKGARGGKASKSEPTAAVKMTADDKNTQQHANWGAFDDTPNIIILGQEKVPIAAQAVEFNVRSLLGQGLKYYAESDDTKKPILKPEIEAFLKKNHIRTEYLEAQAYDLYTFNNAFSQVCFGSGANRKIEGLYHLEGLYCRVSQYVKDKCADREYLYYSSLFADKSVNNKYDNNDRLKSFKLFNHREQDWITTFSKTEEPHFAFHTRPRTSNSYFYASIPHLGLYKKKGWINAVAKVPEIVDTLQNRVASLQYLIYISERFMQNRFEGYLTAKREKKKEYFEEVRQEIEDSLVGTDNALTTICTLYKENINGEIVPAIKVEEFGNNTKRDMWVPESTHGNAEILAGHGVPISQIEIMPGNGKMGGGSGSSTRESYNVRITLNTSYQEKLLEILHIISDYNGWNVRFYLDNLVHETLNKNKDGIAANLNTDPIKQAA